MAKYAHQTQVPVARSLAEIERTLMRYGGDDFSYGRRESLGIAILGFSLGRRQIRMKIPLPKRQEFVFTKRGVRRYDDVIERDWERGCRQVWRAVALIIKAKLEAVESGITTVEDEFLAHTMLPSGISFGEWAKPQIAEIMETGEMPPPILGLPAGEVEE